MGLQLQGVGLSFNRASVQSGILAACCARRRRVRSGVLRPRDARRSRGDSGRGPTVDGLVASVGHAARRRLDELTSALQRGDRLVVSELSRLGRSLGQIVTILDALAKAGVAFVALKENIRVEGKRDIQTRVMTTLFALFAEVERDPDRGADRKRGGRRNRRDGRC